MKKKKRWTPYNKPRRPQKPPKFLTGSRPLLTLDLYPYTTLVLSDCQREILSLATSYELSNLNIGYDEEIFYSCQVRFTTDEEQENPDYETQLMVYKEDYAKYKEELKWWNSEKKKRDAIEAEKKQAKEIQEYKRLKAKYGD